MTTTCDRMTPWFSPGVKPVRPGLYVTSTERMPSHWVMLYWDGKAWYGAGVVDIGRMTAYDAVCVTSEQPYLWRGLQEAA